MRHSCAVLVIAFWCTLPAPARPPQSPELAPTVLKNTRVGVVLPGDSRPGEEVSGSVVTDPERYAGIPALRVIEFELPLRQDARGVASLEGIAIETGDRRLQHAGGRVLVKIDENATRIPIMIRRGNELTPMAERSVLVTRAPVRAPRDRDRPAVPQDYETPPVHVAGNLQVIRGPLDGRSADTEIVVDDVPAQVIAETPRAVYWRLPPDTEPGLHRVTLVEDAVTTSFLIAVLKLVMGADRLELLKGESTPFRAVISGLEDLPDSVWRGGTPSDLVDVGGLRRLAPDVRFPSQENPGVILLRIENASRDSVSMAPAKKEAAVVVLGAGDFIEGRYTFTGTITSKRGGPFSINGLVVPLLAPIRGEPGER